MSVTEPLPDRLECCDCGHPKEWHSIAGFCLIALDIDQECPCSTYNAKMTLLLKPIEELQPYSETEAK